MNWKVTARLGSPLAGEAPHLCAILEYEMAQRQGLAGKLSRGEPAPPAGAIHIPCLRGAIGGVEHIPRVSSPILMPRSVRHERIAKRLAVEHSSLLAEEHRLSVAVGNNRYRSYFLPLKTGVVDRVVWFVAGTKRRSLKSLLDSVKSLGKKRSVGYAIVTAWEFEEIEHDWSWFAKVEQGTLLMRPLPFCDQLPTDLIGFRRDFGACIPPMWHPDRYMEIVKPC